MRWESMNAFAERFSQYGLNRNALHLLCHGRKCIAVTQGKLDSPQVYEDIDQETLQSVKIAGFFGRKGFVRW
jgi:hypothetical protein